MIILNAHLKNLIGDALDIRRKTKQKQFQAKFLKFVGEIQQLVRKRSPKNSLCNFALHFAYYLSIALFKFLPHSKTKNAKILSVFGKNDSHHLSNFLKTHSF